MANPKLKLPTRGPSTASVSELLGAEDPKIRLEQIKADSAKEVGRLQVIKEAIGLFSSLLDVMKSHQQRHATRTEWEGRVEQAELQVSKAEIELRQEEHKTTAHLADLQIIRDTQDRLLTLFDQVMLEMSGDSIDAQTKRESRQYLLQLADKLVQLKK